MNRALWLLIWLQGVGWCRYLGRNLGTVRGAVLAGIGLLVFLPWLLTVVFTFNEPRNGLDAEQIRRYTPVLLLAFCLSNVAFSPHDRAIYFSPPEILFLFSGPFTRRGVLAYKLLMSLLVTIPGALFASLMLRVRDGSWLAGFVGLLLVLAFTQLFTTALGLLANVLGEQVANRSRRIVVLAALLFVAGLTVLVAGPQPDWSSVPGAILDSTAWQIVSWPLQSFGEVMRAKTFGEAVVPALIALIVNALLIVVIFGLDAQYTEAVAASSARLDARLRRLRGQNPGEGGESISVASARWEVPMPPRLGGIGPIAWRQLTAALRSSGRLLVVLLLLMVGVVALLASMDHSQAERVPLFLIGLGVWLSLVLPSAVPYDFRGDIDRIAVLKTLPIAPWRLALGQLLAPTLLLSLVCWLPLGITLLYVPEQATLLLTAAGFVPVVNFYLLALENLLFLFFPVRLAAVTPGDFQTLGRNVLLGLGKILGLGLLGGLATVCVLLTSLLLGSTLLGLILGWLIVLLGGLVQLPLIVLAFNSFDVGRDTPS